MDMYKRYFLQTNNGIILFDKSEIILEVNPNAAEILQEPMQDFIGKPITYIFNQSEIYDKFKESITNSSNTFEFILEKENATLHLVVNANKFTEGGFIEFQDLTQIKQLEEKAEIEQSMQLLGLLARGISHDFNNKLQEIIGSLNLLVLDSKNLSGMQRKFLFDAQKSLFQATGLVKQFQYLTRDEKSKNIKIDIYSVIKNVFGFLDRASSKVIEKKILFEPNTYFVYADPVKINQVFLNLTNTIIRAMGNLEIKSGNYINIDSKLADESPVLKSEEEQNHMIHISIEDNGSSLGKNLKDKVFLPYSTLEGNDQSIMRGIGLSVSYDIITRQFKGSIEVRGQDDKTVIDIFLPGAVQLENEIDFEKEISSKLPGGSETILIADDEQIVRNVLSITLKQLGYNVELVSNGEECVKVYKDNMDKIDLILLDVTMPKLSGSEVMKRIFEFDKDAKIVISSGHSEQEIQKGILAKANGHLNKPYNRKDLAIAIRKVLDEK